MDARHPIGTFEAPASITPAMRHESITAIAVLPGQLQEILRDMSDVELESRYREGGWTVRQVVHHLADSHLQSYSRYRLALTEDEPVIKPYNEAAVAELPDAKNGPVDVSLQLLASLHARWVLLLKGMSDADFQRKYMHPELGMRTLDLTTGVYAWHGKHHLAHIRLARGLAAST